jgi:phosphopantothenoylcysteine decarboxylase
LFFIVRFSFFILHLDSSAMPNILLSATGSVAAIRTPLLYQSLVATGHSVKVVATDAACYFFDAKELSPGVLIRDADEWPRERYGRGDPVLHIELRRWADLLLIAPLDANTLAKIATGLADNCLTCVWRAWDPARPVVLAPAMNTLMWEHPLTWRHLRQLIADFGGAAPTPTHISGDALVDWLNANCRNLYMVPPIEKELACGDVGIGAMAEVPTIVTAVQSVLARNR